MQNLKNRLEIATGKKVTVSENTVKTNVKNLDGVDLFNLSKIQQETECGVLIKRSGTGICVILTEKE